MLKLKKETSKKIIFLTYIFSTLLLTVGFLVGTPRAVKIVESNLTFLGNQKQEKLEPINQEARGLEKSSLGKAIGDLPSLNLKAKAVLVKDFDTGQIFFEKNMDAKLSPASTTKIMTALVAVEHFRSADILTVTQDSLIGGSTMGLKFGEQLTFRSLLYGMMLNSGNDAAFTIAANFPGGIPAFVTKMNQKARELGLASTHFDNPAGFDSPTHYSSAADLFEIGKAVALNAQLAKVVATKETSVISWDKSNSHNLKNLNKLLPEEGVLGIKTGYTEGAGESFVGLVERKNHKIITVVLNSEDRFGETKSLINWVYDNFSWD